MEHLTALATALLLALTTAGEHQAVDHPDPQAHQAAQEPAATTAEKPHRPPAADPFHQGPESVGRMVYVSGQVIGLRHDCHLVIADRPGNEWRGLGGAGRFFYCADGVAVGDRVEGAVEQVGTRRARVGPRWRVLPVYRPAYTTN